MANTVATRLTVPPRDQQAGSDLDTDAVANLFEQTNTLVEHGPPPMVLDLVADTVRAGGDEWRYRIKRPRGEELPNGIVVTVRATMTGTGATDFEAEIVETSEAANQTLTATGKATIELDAFDEGPTFDLIVRITYSTHTTVKITSICVQPARARTTLPGGMDLDAAANKKPVTVERHRRAIALVERARAEQYGQAIAAADPAGWPDDDGEAPVELAVHVEIPDRIDGPTAALVLAFYLDGTAPDLEITFAGQTIEPTLTSGWTEHAITVDCLEPDRERPAGDVMAITIGTRGPVKSFCAWWAQ